MSDSEGTLLPGFQSSLFFESPEEIYARVFRELKPRTALPALRVEFCRFANADSFIRLENGALRMRISDLLASAPAPVMEALAYILLGKLYRKPIARPLQSSLSAVFEPPRIRCAGKPTCVRQIRGRKFSSPDRKAQRFTTWKRFSDAVSTGKFFDGLMGMPRLGWSRGRSRNIFSLGPFRPFAQCDYHQPDFRPAGASAAGAGVCDVPRNAAFTISGGSQWSAAAGTHQGISGGGKEISAIKKRLKEILKRLYGG